MKSRRVALVMLFASLATVSLAQNPVSSLTLGPDIIGNVKTAPAITTKISFPEKVIEVICGDLYDPASGKGSFVLQTSGNDVFLKPVVPKGMSNMFVKTGDDGKHTYNFDLEIVPVAEAHRIVNVQMAVTQAPPPQPPSGATSVPDAEAAKAEFDRIKAQVEAAAQQEASQIIRKAQQQADRITAEADAKVIELEKQVLARSAQAIEDHFVQALMLGLREYKINDPRTSVKKIVVQIEPRVLAFDEKSFLRYTITNNSEMGFAFSGISLEVMSGKETTRPIRIRVIQSKSDNRLDPGETLNGVIAFESKQVQPKDRLALFIRGEDSAEFARVVIQ